MGVNKAGLRHNVAILALKRYGRQRRSISEGLLLRLLHQKIKLTIGRAASF